VAGFDYEFKFAVDLVDLVASALAAQRRRARHLGLTMNARNAGPGQVIVQINGNSRRMDVLGYRLAQELPLICEGVSSPRLRPSERRRIGLGIADMYLRGRETTRKSDETMTLHGVAETRYYFPVYEFSPRGAGSEALQHRLRLTEELIADWDVRNISPFTVLEELHTASELLLAELVPLPRGKDFYPDRLEAAHAGRFLSQDDMQLLTLLSKFRNDARHRADGGFTAWLDSNWESVSLILEGLRWRIEETAQGAADEGCSPTAR
jgi:hypothetical protein